MNLGYLLVLVATNIFFASFGFMVQPKVHEQWWRNHYATHADRFTSWFGNVDAVARLSARAHIKKQGYRTVLDIPCGMCAEYSGYKKEGHEIDYIGMDITEQFVDRARGLGIQAVQASIEKIPCNDSVVDVSYAHNILEHLPGYEAALYELIRVARQEVIVVFFMAPRAGETYINPQLIEGDLLYHNRYDKDQLEQYIIQNSKVEWFDWEQINENECILHIYLRKECKKYDYRQDSLLKNVAASVVYPEGWDALMLQNQSSNQRSVQSQPSFEFINYRDPLDGGLDDTFFKLLVDSFHPDIFFETGTYLAETTLHAAPYFKELHTVELHNGLFKRAQSRLAQLEKIKVYHGKSSQVITQVVPRLEGTILFWLDAYHGANDLSKRFGNTQDPHAGTAISEELQAIKNVEVRNCVILINNMSNYGTRIENQEYAGTHGYPTIQELKRDLLDINSSFAFAVIGNILLAYDAQEYQPSFSKSVTACTKLYFYDGYNVTNDELVELEKIIMRAPAHEKDFMEDLYKSMREQKGLLCAQLPSYRLIRGIADRNSEAV